MHTTIADKLPLLMNCNGSRNMPASFTATNVDMTKRDEGTAAHWLASQGFNGHDINALIDQPAVNGFRITAEMIDHVANYISALDCGEMEVTTSYGTDDWYVNGRADHIAFATPIDTLIVDDFKYGRRAVEAVENWTLLSHAIGYCIFRRITPARIILRIHQPRGYHPEGPLRSWEITYAELMQYYERIAAVMANPSNELRTGPHCDNCHAVATCHAARKARQNSIDVTDVVFSDEMTNEALSYELDLFRTAAARIKGGLDALEELAAHRLTDGKIIDNYALEKQYGHTRFKTGLSPQLLTMTTGIDCAKPGTITPAEFKRRGGSDAAYDALTERPMTGIKLVRITADARAKKLLRK